MAEKTNVCRIFDQKKIKYESYSFPVNAAVSGTEAADIMGKSHDAVFKTLVTEGKSGNHYVFMIPVDRELDLKKAYKAVGEKSIDMVKSKELLLLTGYIHGGCSPVGMKKTFVTVVDISAERLDTVTFSAGKIGYQVETTLSELSKVIQFKLGDVCVDRGER